MPLETSTQGKEQTLGWSDKLLRTGDILSSCGFILNLVWHYLILFSPALVGPGVYDSKFLMGRQVFLYASLAVSFVLVGLLLGRAHRLRTKLLTSFPGIVVFGLLSSLVSVACAGNCCEEGCNLRRRRFARTCKCLRKSGEGNDR